jgi:hypothetical protein
VGSIIAARRPILPLHHFVGNKIGRRGIRYFDFSTPKSGDNSNYFTIILSFSFVDNSKITIFALLN